MKLHRFKRNQVSTPVVFSLVHYRYPTTLFLFFRNWATHANNAVVDEFYRRKSFCCVLVSRLECGTGVVVCMICRKQPVFSILLVWYLGTSRLETRTKESSISASRSNLNCEGVMKVYCVNSTNRAFRSELE